MPVGALVLLIGLALGVLVTLLVGFDDDDNVGSDVGITQVISSWRRFVTPLVVALLHAVSKAS